MQVGRMRYRIEIQDYKSTQDADGFETRVDEGSYGMGRHRSRFR